ncbi:viral aspartic protease [Pseudooceanicola sp. GBMRC 2024]|uniref:Viral aspartic protease n=1 Tax=Pseudooceanicola albus TaxID=2692189 RepID=A0A6L7G3C9_9RHOB|nr:viral aspartic protease [Pseudooceanicola albus]
MSARVLPGILLLGLAACGGGGGGGGSTGNAPSEGTEIDTPGIESYVTDDTGYTRARITTGTGTDDATVLNAFDTGDSPAGYKRLITLTEQKYLDNMNIEVIAQMSSEEDDATVVRILRLTADQGPFDNVDDNGDLIASGKYYFRGSAQVYASVDGGDLQVGVGDLENLVVDFDSETVTIDLRTPYDPDNGSDIETELTAEVPLNVLTGTFGGDVTLSSRSASTGETTTASGELRGNINGDEDGLSRLVENMTTSGIFSVSGDSLDATGIFWGSQLNYDD